MAVNTPENPLLVLEYGGTARSGKGTIVEHIAATHPGAATEETGADYRLITETLRRDGRLEAGMPEPVIQRAVGGLATNELAEMVANRPQFVAANGLTALYTPEVNGLVSSVSPILTVRKAVKDGFKQRVEAVADDEAHDILLVDGRNLAPVVESIDRTRLILRTFVSCYDYEAAWREVERNGQFGDQTAFREAFQRIQKRNHDDANRPVDPVKPEANAIDYWYDTDVFNLTTHYFADKLYAGDFTRALFETFQGAREFTDVVRHGAGHLAVTRSRQIHFDTTPFRTLQGDSKTRMLQAADGMFAEALDSHQHLQQGIRGALAAMTRLGY